MRKAPAVRRGRAAAASTSDLPRGLGPAAIMPLPRWTCLLAGLALVLSACGSDAKSAKTPPPPKRRPPHRPRRPRRATRPRRLTSQSSRAGPTRCARAASRRRRASGRSRPRLQRHAADPAHEARRRRSSTARSRAARRSRRRSTPARTWSPRSCLTERPGPGECGTGVGNEAYTAFLIRRHKIVQWRRVVEPAPAASAGWTDRAEPLAEEHALADAIAR